MLKLGHVFGIGLPRTGNQSLWKALLMLGFKRVAQDVRPLEKLAQFSAIVETRFSVEELEERYPGSYYILTVRNPEDWLRSLERSKKKIQIPSFWHPVWFAENPLQIYEERLKQANIIPERTLIFDVRQGWCPLCVFLRRRIPEISFPNVDSHR